MTGSIFDKSFDHDGTRRPDDRNRRVPGTEPGGAYLLPPTGPLPHDDAFATEIFGSGSHGQAAYGQSAHDERAYAQSAPRAIRARGGKTLIAVGSLAVGVFAAGGAATALAAGGDDPAVALASSGNSSRPAESGDKKPAGDDDRDSDEGPADGYKVKADTCIRLDEKTLAAIDAARAAGPAARVDNKRKIKVRLDDGDVVVSMNAVSVVKCKWPVKPAPTRSSNGPRTTPSATSSSTPPKATTTTKTTPPKTTSTKPPKATTTTKTSTSTPPKTTTTTTKPTPKPTTSTAS